jgi:glycosyltransferase involved in cell wall biosynthesis
MSDQLTILHVLAPAKFGGLESVVRLLATGQHARGHRVIVSANVAPGPYPLLDALTAAGIHVDRFQATSRQSNVERTHIRDLIDTHHVQIVHTHGYRPDILDIPVARKAGVAVASTLHGFTGGDWKVRLYEWLQVRAVRNADAVIAASTGIVTRCEHHGVSRTRLHLIRNAYAPAPGTLSRDDARRALKLAHGIHHIVWVGRLSEEKAPDRVIEALSESNPLDNVRLSIIGDGPMRESLQARAAELGIADRVIFHGIVPDASLYLRGFDSFALTSRTEGTPLVLLEAMAAELPIVATAVGGVPDVVSTQEAELVNTNTDERTVVVTLATALRHVITGSPDVVRRTHAAHTRLTTDFGVDTWLDRYDEVYRAIRHSSRTKTVSVRGAPANVL